MDAIRTALAPEAIGPYSQGVRVGNLLFCSGQIGLDPKGGALVEGGVAAETERVLLNLRAVVEAAGLDMGRVVKTTVYMTDLSKFAEMNGVYGRFFREPYPARATVGVAVLPRGASVEIDAVALFED